MELQKTNRRSWSWTENRKQQADTILNVCDELAEYWPLTLRQVYYRLVAAGHIQNKRSRYIDLSNVVKHMRIDEMLPWDALEDRVRKVTSKRGFEDRDQFIQQEVDGFLEGYTRCLVQDQDRYVEIWCEKDALSQIFYRVAWPYCIRSVTCRGYQSITFLKDYANRARQALEKGQEPVILYFGDLDPSGVQMLEATAQTLEEDLHLEGVNYIRCALNPEHIIEHQLPHNPDAVKENDSRYRKYVDRFGEVAVELDALHPATLTQMAVDAVQAQFDMERFNEQRELEVIDRRKLAAVKAKIMAELTSIV